MTNSVKKTPLSVDYNMNTFLSNDYTDLLREKVIKLKKSGVKNCFD